MIRQLLWVALAVGCFGAAGFFAVSGYLDHFWLGYLLAAKWLVIASGATAFAVYRFLHNPF